MYSGAIIGEGDRKSWDPRGPMIWDNFSIFRTNCAILTSYIRAYQRTCVSWALECLLSHCMIKNGPECSCAAPHWNSDAIISRLCFKRKSKFMSKSALIFAVFCLIFNHLLKNLFLIMLLLIHWLPVNEEIDFLNFTFSL